MKEQVKGAAGVATLGRRYEISKSQEAP